MSIWQEQLSQNIRLIGLQGRLDQTQTPQLETELNSLLDTEKSIRLIVDLTQVSYINSGGLRCLVGGWRRARQQDGNLVLCGLSERLQEIFAMVGFDKVFQIYDDVTQAQAALQT
jgi:anti-anti-sigma factor